MLIMLGVMTGVVGLLADVISANRKLLEDIQKRVRKLDYSDDKKNAGE